MIVCASRRFRCDLRVRSEQQGGDTRVRSRSQVLRELLEKPGIIRGPCCHDALSAKLIEQAGFEFAFMSGFCTSAARLGAPDVALISYYEMLDQGRAIHEATNSLPIIGDGDTGWGNALNVRRTVQGYASAGFAGVLIEDQVHPKSCGHVQNKVVVDRKEAAMRIRAACDARDEGTDIVLVARSDARQAESLYEALYRAELFAAEGADVLFIDALQSVEEMKEFAKISSLKGIPKMANMLEGGKTPIIPEEQLQDLGFKLVSYPLSLLSSSIKAMQISLQHLKNGQIPPDQHLLSFPQLKSVIGFDECFEFVDKYNQDNQTERTSRPQQSTRLAPQKQKEKKEQPSILQSQQSTRLIPQKQKEKNEQPPIPRSQQPTSQVQQKQKEKKEQPSILDRKSNKTGAKQAPKSVADIKKEAKSLFEMPKKVRESMPQQFASADLEKKRKEAREQIRKDMGAGTSEVSQFGATEEKEEEEEKIRKQIITSQKSMFSQITKPKQNKDILAAIGKSKGSANTQGVSPPLAKPKPPASNSTPTTPGVTSNKQSTYEMKKPAVVQRWGDNKPIEEVVQQKQQPLTAVKPKPFQPAKDTANKQTKQTVPKNSATTDQKSGPFFSQEKMRKIFQNNQPKQNNGSVAEQNVQVENQNGQQKNQNGNGNGGVNFSLANDVEIQQEQTEAELNNQQQEKQTDEKVNDYQEIQQEQTEAELNNQQQEKQTDEKVNEQQEIQSGANLNNQQEIAQDETRVEDQTKQETNQDKIITEQKADQEIQQNQNQAEQNLQSNEVAENIEEEKIIQEAANTDEKVEADPQEAVVQKTEEIKNEEQEEKKEQVADQIQSSQQIQSKEISANQISEKKEENKVVAQNGYKAAKPKKKFDLSQLAKKPVNSEENFKEFRVYASIVDDEVPAQHYRSQRVPKRELKAQSVAAPETTQMATLAPDQNKTQVEEQVTQETSNNTSLQNGVNLEQPQQIHQEQQQIHTDNVGTAVQPNGLDTPDNTNANGNGIASGSLVQEAAVEVEEEEEEEPWVSRSGLPVVEADAVLQPTGFRPEGEGETAKQSHHNPHLKIKITEAKTHKVKLETTVPAGYVKQVSSWIPEVQSVDLKVLMDIADQLPVGNTQPVSEFKSGKGDLVQIWVEEDQK